MIPQGDHSKKMNKTLDNLSRIFNVPSLGTELMLPANMPPVFPAISCKKAETVFNIFAKEKSMGKEGLSLLAHLYDFDDPHEDSCPYRLSDKEVLAESIRTYFNFDK